MFAGPEINKIVAATLAASAASNTGASNNTAAYLRAYKDMLLGLDKLDDEIAQERSTANMRRLNAGRANGTIV
ncbi:hypothetical protein SAMN02799636_01575 [Methylobacterium sp. 275MFSha3.1]|uniref:hypothetical protein n=1 Tax=Methylobacterium sp. 275MFSha3.1 TaxID=1502746 RepID=UPI0008A734C2|nr:hypothetical protein [Methylobacterium sp. 275MFSha3.1]SEH34266.1 hypothetical protein SAMN02799636_01575 [Methylobacterium sp. 275MFSha3.1]